MTDGLSTCSFSGCSWHKPWGRRAPSQRLVPVGRVRCRVRRQSVSPLCECASTFSWTLMPAGVLTIVVFDIFCGPTVNLSISTMPRYHWCREHVRQGRHGGHSNSPSISAMRASVLPSSPWSVRTLPVALIHHLASTQDGVAAQGVGPLQLDDVQGEVRHAEGLSVQVQKPLRPFESFDRDVYVRVFVEALGLQEGSPLAGSSRLCGRSPPRLVRGAGGAFRATQHHDRTTTAPRKQHQNRDPRQHLPTTMLPGSRTPDKAAHRLRFFTTPFSAMRGCAAARPSK